MMGGILIGKFSPATETKVHTFLHRTSDRQYYYANTGYEAYRYRTYERTEVGVGMFLSAPVILAFWSE